MINKDALKQVLAERLNKVSPFILDDYLFPEQLSFVRDPNRYATAVCSVRAGKSVACAADLIDTAINKPGTTGLYVTLARSSAKKIIWPELKKINFDFKLGGTPNESDLSFFFPKYNSWIYCFGASSASEIEKIRGLSNVALVYLDETQAMREYVKELVEDIVSKRLYDTSGRCRMIGTPSPVPSGYFYKCSKAPEWAHHSWTMHQNPWLFKKSGKTPSQLIEEDCKLRGVTIMDPSIRRECFGEWALDKNALVFKYSDEKNSYQFLPTLTDYVIAVDVGSNAKDRDRDAIAVIGWHKNQNECYLVEELMGQDLGISGLASQIEKLVKKYNPLKVVMDTGGLGRKVADEIRKRHSLPIVAAEKTRKSEFIALLNDALQTSRFKAKSNSIFAQDAMFVEWDMKKSKSDRMVIKDEPHSDICDAVLYGFREALHWLSTPAPIKVDPRDKSQWVKHNEKLMEEALERQIQHEQSQEYEADIFAIQDLGMDENPFSYYLNKRKST